MQWKQQKDLDLPSFPFFFPFLFPFPSLSSLPFALSHAFPSLPFLSSPPLLLLLTTHILPCFVLLSHDPSPASLPFSLSRPLLGVWHFISFLPPLVLHGPQRRLPQLLIYHTPLFQPVRCPLEQLSPCPVFHPLPPPHRHTRRPPPPLESLAVSGRCSAMCWRRW